MGVEPNAWSRALPVLCADLLRHWERDARFLCCQKIHIQFSNAEPGGSAYLPRGAFRNYAAARPGGRVLQRGSKPPGRRGQAPAIQRTAPQRAGGQRPPQQRRKNSLGRAGEDTRPTGFRKPVCLCVGAGPRPARGRTLCASTGETEPGMLVRRRQAQKWDRAGSNFLPAQAPSGAGRNRAQALLILRAGNVLLTSRGNPRNRGPGVRRIWTRSAHPEPPPGDPLVSFPSLGKKLAARRRRNLPARNETALSSPPHPSGLTASHLPPRGKALCGGAALIRPRGKAYNSRRRNAVSHKILLLTFLLRKVSRWSSLPPEFSHPAPAAPWTSGPPLSAWSAHPQCCGF